MLRKTMVVLVLLAGLAIMLIYFSLAGSDWRTVSSPVSNARTPRTPPPSDRQIVFDPRRPAPHLRSRGVSCEAGNLCRTGKSPWPLLHGIDVPPVRDRKDPAWCEAEAVLAERSRVMAEQLFQFADRIRRFYVQKPNPRDTAPETARYSIEIWSGWKDPAAFLVQHGLAVPGSLPEGQSWCQTAKTRLQRESECTRRQYAAWEERSRRGFAKNHEWEAAYQEHMNTLEACPPPVGVFNPVECLGTTRCRIDGVWMTLDGIEAPDRFVVDARRCPEAGVLAERGRDMVEGLIHAGRSQLTDWSDDGGAHAGLRVYTGRADQAWEDLNHILIRHGLAVDGRHADWCDPARAIMKAESHCTRNAYAAWADRVQAGFTTPQQKADAFDVHFDALEQCIGP